MLYKDMFQNTITEMWEIAKSIDSTEELLILYECVWRKFVFVEDCIYDYEEGTNEYRLAIENTDAWGHLQEYLFEQIKEEAIRENYYREVQPGEGNIVWLAPFMEQYGYRNSGGWWIKKEDKTHGMG